MSFNATAAKGLLEHFDFAPLFVDELGWERHSAALSVEVAGSSYSLTAIAQKRGMVAWFCDAPPGQLIPDRATRKKIGHRVAGTTLEHLIIFADATRREQIWCWARRREVGRPASMPEHFWYASSGNRAFLQRLAAIAFSLEEEESLTLVDVTARARSAFDVERVTKAFYDQFKTEHKAFLDFLSGVTDVADREWYASLMLNRLMFIYFMQRKGFLNGERDYLRDRLARCQKEKGADKFYSFYRYFLLRLFHEGLGGKERNADLDKLLGRIPYLNGGLFEMHPIEERCPDIRIPDEAFTRIFAYFDRYQWHLDERPLRNDNEINPDVLGYIFEKYINQKQMGAYYTKEDITEYISKSTVVPFLFDAAKVKCKVAFENPGGPTIWDHIRTDPDRYIYGSVKHGVERPLPAEIAVGIDDVSARGNWNRAAPPQFALPTEIWREVVARRTRYADLRAKLAAGDVREINDFVTLNIDIRQFAQDVIERCEGPDLLRAFWKAIESVTILDPTCGSGAFLFAALNVLEPLYESCLERMEAFVADLERSGVAQHPKKFEDFKAVLTKVGVHPNARYFILKSIILNNLFGVDIMEEAVEICKLRMFLKLAAQVEPDPNHTNLGIEPLPDIDFNIRAGNTLVGYATYEGVKAALSSKLDLDNVAERIARSAADLQQASDVFRARQMEGDGSVPPADKAKLRERLKKLDDELNLQLASEYRVETHDKAAYAKWLKSHEPFHWFIEFHGIMSKGGFDVILGNPPYVEYSKVRTLYTVRHYQTEASGNLFAMCGERSFALAQHGRSGLVLPVSAVCTERTASFQSILFQRKIVWAASFDVFPARLFEGAAQRLAIVLAVNEACADGVQVLTTAYKRWFAAERANLMSSLSYADTSANAALTWIPRVDTSYAVAILRKLKGRSLEYFVRKNGASPIYIHRIINNFVKAIEFTPRFKREGEPATVSPDFKRLYVEQRYQKAIVAVLNSNLFYWYWRCHGDGFHCGFKEIGRFPAPLGNVSHANLRRLEVLGEQMTRALQSNSKMKVRNQKKTGRIELQTFSFAPCKPSADLIDKELGRDQYHLTDEEIDYVINYDIKYRMGQSDGEEEMEDDD